MTHAHQSAGDTTDLRAEICRVGRSLFERGYLHATAGNISVRLAEGAGYLDRKSVV